MRKIYQKEIEKEIYYNCSYQVIWSVKYKRQLLVDDICQRLSEIIIEKCEDSSEMNLLDIDINPVYVCLYLSVSPTYGIHKAVKYLKSETSSVLRAEFSALRSKLPTLWDNSYLVISTQVGEITDKDITEYLSTRPNSQRKAGK